MDVRVEDRAGVTWIHVEGRLDASGAPDLSRQLDAILDEGRHQLVFQLAELDYLSSAGVRSFLSVAKRIDAANGRLAFVSPQDFVQRVFEIAGLTQLFTICESEQDARVPR